MAAAHSPAVDASTAARGCVSADEAFRQLGIDRTTGYRAIREGTFPLPVIRVGRLIRIPVASLHRMLAGEGAGYDDRLAPPGREPDLAACSATDGPPVIRGDGSGRPQEVSRPWPSEG